MSHSRQTEHYGLPLYNGTDIINPLTDFNNANEAIDIALYNANVHANEAKDTANEASASVATYDAKITAAVEASNAAAIKAENVEKMMAEEFDPLKVGGYNVGDIVIHDGHLYYFINRHTGAWDASDVAEGNIGDAMAETIEQGKQEIAEETQEAMAEIAEQTEKVTHTQEMIAPLFDAEKDGGYAVGDVVAYADKLYRFTSVHSGAWTGADVEQIDVEQQVTEMKQSFQVGVDTIYNAITAQGVQPSSSTPSDCATAIGTVASDKYNSGKSAGITEAQAVTWTANCAFPTSSYDSNGRFCAIDLTNVVKMVFTIRDAPTAGYVDGTFQASNGVGVQTASAFHKNSSGFGTVVLGEGGTEIPSWAKILTLYRGDAVVVFNVSITYRAKILR